MAQPHVKNINHIETPTLTIRDHVRGVSKLVSNARPAVDPEFENIVSPIYVLNL